MVKSQVSDAALVMRRREQIVGAAVGLFASQGYYRTTIQQIARRAGISTGLVYQYAETKEDLLLLALMRVMEHFRHELEEAAPARDPLARLHSALDTYCRVVDRNRDAAILAYRSTMSLPRHYRDYVKQAELDTNELLASRLRDCIAAGLFRDVDCEMVTYRLVMHAHTWSLKYWRLAQVTNLDAYIAEGFDFFVNAMATPRGRAQYQRFLKSRSRDVSDSRLPDTAAADRPAVHAGPVPDP